MGVEVNYYFSSTSTGEPSRPTIPALRRVRVVDGTLQGVHICVRDVHRQQQARLLEAYDRACGRDARVPLKQGGLGSLTGPVLEFMNLPETPHAAVNFTRTYGPLAWADQYVRRESRKPRPQERLRGVTGRSGRILDRQVWRFPLREFWKQQRRFRAVVELAAAAHGSSEELPRRMRAALDVLPELCETFGQQLGVAGHDALRANTLQYLDENEASAKPLRTYGLTVRVGELVCNVLTDQTPQPIVTFDPDLGFRCVPKFTGVLDILYFMVVEQLPALRFCANCGATYFKHRPDKNTCSQRCAMLLGRRTWARAHRAARRDRGKR
jgi:hypothetical protein